MIYKDNRPWYKRRSKGCSSAGCSWVIVGVLCVHILCIFMISILRDGCSTSNKSYNITQSTVERSKLDSSQCTQISEWLENKCKYFYISNDDETVIQGLKYFYSQTGVQPYLILIDNIEGNSNPTKEQFIEYLSNIYNTYMPDEGHLIVGFLKNQQDNDIACFVGKDAKRIIDEEVQHILLDYAEYYNINTMNINEYFSTIFTKTADKIMQVDYVKPNFVKSIIVVISLCIIIIVVLRIRKTKLTSTNNSSNELYEYNITNNQE